MDGAYVEFGGVSWFSKKLIANLLGQNGLILVFYKTSENEGPVSYPHLTLPTT